MVTAISCEQILYGLYAGTQISVHRAIRATVTSLCRGLASITVVALLCFLQEDILTLIVGIIIVDGIFCAYTIIDVTRPWESIESIGRCVDFCLIRDILLYCIPLGLSVITGTLCTYIDKMFVSRLLDFDDLAVYSNMSMELPLAGISGAFIAVSTPCVVKLVGQNRFTEAVSIWGDMVELTAVILFPVIMVLFSFPKQIITLLFSEEYVVGYGLFRIFTVLEVFRITYFGFLLKAYGKSKIILFCSIVTLILNTLLNAFFYYLCGMGMYGFAAATVISTFIALLLQLIMTCNISGIGFCNILPWRRIGSVVVANVVIGCLAVFISKQAGIYDDLHSTRLFGIIAVCVTIYYSFEFKRIKRIYYSTKRATEI